MWSLFSEARTRQLSVFWSAIIIVGLFVTRWFLIMPSIGMAGLFVTSLGYAIKERRIAQGIAARAFLSLTLVYGVHLLSGLVHNKLSDNTLWCDLVLQLPFLLLPLSFLFLPAWRTTHKRIVWGVVITCCLVSAVASTSNYVVHLQEMDGLYNRSQVMPTEPDHVRFSLLISIAILSGCTLLLQKELAVRWQLLIGVAVGALFVFQHLLAARSGLLSLYAGGALLAIGLGWQLKRWKTAGISIVVILAIGFACFQLLPTLQMRIHNTYYDTMQRSSVNAANNFSVTARLYSYEIAKTIIQQHPLLGVGKPQLEPEMAQQYSYRYPEIDVAKYTLPHNQFIYNLAAYGVVGLTLFLIGFYYPLWVGIRQRNLLGLVVYLIITISFLTEYTLENNLGVVIGIFFSLLALAPVSDAAPSTTEGQAPIHAG